jgi:hypothetical protein
MMAIAVRSLLVKRNDCAWSYALNFFVDADLFVSEIIGTIGEQIG